MTELLLPVLAVLTGYTVLGLTGFGSALIVVPLLAWLRRTPFEARVVRLVSLFVLAVGLGLFVERVALGA
mgnify:CR=1 FL=1